MKRLFIALTAIGISISALAALPAATDPTLVAVPQLPGGFFIGGQAYYLQPSDTHGDLDYARILIRDPTVSLTTIKNMKPGYDWGWGVNAGYIFPGTGNDIEASFFHLGAQDSASLTGTSGPVGVAGLAGTFSYPLPYASPFSGVAAGSLFNNVDPLTVAEALLRQTLNQVAATQPGIFTTFSNVSTTGNHIESSVKYTVNRVDVTAGQYIDVGCRLTLHPKVGLTWAEVKRDVTRETAGSLSARISRFASATVSPTFVNDYRADAATKVEENSKFDGVGPIFGLDSSYYIAYGFGAVAHVDALLLVGDVNSSTTLATAGTVTDLTTGQVTTSTVGIATQDMDSTRRVVPVVDGKLGLDYTFVFNNTANSDLTLEAGWQFSNYFNAIDRQVTIPHSTSDLGLNGPYVSLVFHV